MILAQGGADVDPDALDLVVIDRENEDGVNIEPNPWMRHVQE
jgi:hypothetical protein